MVKEGTYILIPMPPVGIHPLQPMYNEMEPVIEISMEEGDQWLWMVAGGLKLWLWMWCL